KIIGKNENLGKETTSDRSNVPEIILTIARQEEEIEEQEADLFPKANIEQPSSSIVYSTNQEAKKHKHRESDFRKQNEPSYIGCVSVANFQDDKKNAATESTSVRLGKNKHRKKH